jgi:ABC-2 type transport system permease protein
MSAFLRRVRAIARKEMWNLLREPRTLMVCFLEPILTLILYGFCLNFDLSRIPFAVWDQDHSQAGRLLVERLNAGGAQRPFELLGYVAHPQEVEDLLAHARARYVLVIPHGFGSDAAAGKPATVQVLIDAADSNTAAVASGYLGGAISAYNARLTEDGVARQHGAHSSAYQGGVAMSGSTEVTDPIDIRWRVFYNPQLSSRRFIIPGLIAVLLSILAATLTSTTITRERELGSMESLLTSPVGAADLVIGKMLPYMLIAAINVTVILIMGGIVFGVWPRGNVITLAAFTLLFLPGMLAMGVFISAAAPTQQFALVLATLAAFLPTMFVTGFAFPRSNMAWIVQVLSWPLPATQYLIATRGIFLKGVGWEVLWPQAVWLVASGLGLMGMAIGMVRVKLARGLG